jgi:hypothetical protein
MISLIIQARMNSTKLYTDQYFLDQAKKKKDLFTLKKALKLKYDFKDTFFLISVRLKIY